MDKSYVSMSSLTFQQVHQLLESLKTRHCCAYQKCNSEVESQVPRYLSQENQMDRTLLDISTFPYQKPQMKRLFFPYAVNVFIPHEDGAVSFLSSYSYHPPYNHLFRNDWVLDLAPYDDEAPRLYDGAIPCPSLPNRIGRTFCIGSGLLFLRVWTRRLWSFFMNFRSHTLIHMDRFFWNAWLCQMGLTAPRSICHTPKKNQINSWNFCLVEYSHKQCQLWANKNWSPRNPTNYSWKVFIHN